MIATPSPASASQPSFDWLLWLPWLLGAAGLTLCALLWRRYRHDSRSAPVDVEPEPAEPTGAAPIYRTSGPWLTVSLRPVRAGLNMVTAVADCEITVFNEGAAPAEGVRASLALLAAHAGQQAEIAAVYAEPITRSVVPAFTLQAGEARTFRGVAAGNLDTLRTMRAGGREMLVPLVLLQLQHRDADGVEHRTSQSFVVGVERVDSPKLAPFWVDSVRMVDQVGARPSGAPERREVLK